jgi:hypothetical protein
MWDAVSLTLLALLDVPDALLLLTPRLIAKVKHLWLDFNTIASLSPNLPTVRKKSEKRGKNERTRRMNEKERERKNG